MEHSSQLNDTVHRPECADMHDLERRLSLAMQRYAAARDASTSARAQLRELNSGEAVSECLVKSARARFDAVAARCGRLRSLIDELEERLDF